MARKDIPSPFVALGPTFSGKSASVGKHRSGKTARNDKPGGAKGLHRKPEKTSRIGRMSSGGNSGSGFFGPGVWN